MSQSQCVVARSWERFGRVFPKRDERASKLLAAAEFVEEIPEENFHIEHWWLSDGRAYDDWRNEMKLVAPCSVGCSIGHMTQVRAFGLHPDDLKNERQRVFVIVGDVFGVSFKLAEFMFDQYSYSIGRKVRPSDVARRIRYVAAELQGG